MSGREHAGGGAQATRSFPGGPRLRVAFLIGVAVGVFFLPRWWLVAAVAVAMGACWLGLGLERRDGSRGR